VWEVLDDVDSVEVTIQLGLAVMEDESVGERISLDIKSTNKKFVCTSSEKNRYVYKGSLSISEIAKFEVNSEQYSSDWSVKFTPIATVTNPEVPKKKEGK
jgi:glutamate synthase domain-containing protein 1